MKSRLIRVVLLILALLMFVSHRTEAQQPAEVDLCSIAANPMAYNGKIVRVRGVLKSNFEFLAIEKNGCADIPLEHPETVKPRPDFSLKQDKVYKRLSQFWRANARRDRCSANCSKGHYYDLITASVIGRVDAVPEAGPLRKEGKIVAWPGFGHLNRSNVRIVVQSYYDVVAREQEKLVRQP